MRHLQTEILVIGGGATGTGVLRDLAMRGFRCVLVERRDLAYGTTGRYHGLLHSGGRYVVKDPQAARECYQENQVLRTIMPQCIEDTGGYFVLTPGDDPNYVPQFMAGCQTAGIPVEEIPISRMLRQEPLLNPHIQQCFHVPDASADSFLAAELNVESALHHGAQALTYHAVTNLILSQARGKDPASVTGAICHDLIKDEDVQIDASLVVNAGGALAGIIAGMAEIQLAMVPGKGTMLALNRRVVNTVISRCKIPSDGDILVPIHTVVVIGTTDVKVADPDHYGIEAWEIRLMLDEGEKLIPQFRQFRVLRAWAGVRPLVQRSDVATDRDISRAFVLIDHNERDGIDGLITITSGKWTTYRKMAQVTADKVCEKLKVNRACRTHLEPLPSRSASDSSHHYLGTRLKEIEKNGRYDDLVCECELVTQQKVIQALVQSNAVTLDDIRRDTRLGMGPCQGTFCAYRAAGMLHSLRRPAVQETNVALRDFLQERWKGNIPILWGQQLRQARFNELIYVDVLNSTDLPGNSESSLASVPYTRSDGIDNQSPSQATQSQVKTVPSTPALAKDLVVIGAGYAGLFTAWQASLRGLKTRVIAQGWGTPYWSSGCIDVMGFQPPGYSERVTSPGTFLEVYTRTNPSHPYALTGLTNLENAIHSFLQLSKQAGLPYHGTLDMNMQLPTALGTLRPTCLVPETMIAGDASHQSPMLIVGFSGYLDFHPALVSENLNAQGIYSSDVILDLRCLQNHKSITTMVLARLFDEPGFRKEVTDLLKTKIGRAGRIGFPAVLGLNQTLKVKKDLESALGVPVFEIPGLPPSIPGIRMQNILIHAIESHGGSVFTGMEVSEFNKDGQKISTVFSKTPTKQVAHSAKSFVLATGGILGGGISVDNNGYAQERIFNSALNTPDRQFPWLNDQVLSTRGHPIFSTSMIVDPAFRPYIEYPANGVDNLFAVGACLGNCDPIRERSLAGIALATSYAVAEILAGNQPT